MAIILIWMMADAWLINHYGPSWEAASVDSFVHAVLILVKEKPLRLFFSTRLR